MVAFYPTLSEELRSWILAQPVFFTATAPTYEAHINVSPKGMPGSSFAVLSPNRCAYLDATGSGCETAAHLRDNGRITLMWCSFGPSPRILRLFGTGRVIERGGTDTRGCPAFEAAVERMSVANGGALEGLPAQEQAKGREGARLWRGVVEIDFFQVQTSCGYGVPAMAPSAASDINGRPVQHEKAKLQCGVPYSNRATLANTMALWGSDGGQKGRLYQAKNNAMSIDGLPGYNSARRTRVGHGSARERVRNVGEFAMLDIKIGVGRLWRARHSLLLGLLLGWLCGLATLVGTEGTVEWINRFYETTHRRASGRF